jgi:RHS repeat-associated protein
MQTATNPHGTFSYSYVNTTNRIEHVDLPGGQKTQYAYFGSIREMTDSPGAIKARYDYDPWGNRTKPGGGLEAGLGFTGHYYHAASRLYLAPYRAYDSTIGRWISRDPIFECGGIDLYAYVRSNPVSTTDPLSLEVTAYYSIRAGWLTAVDVEQRLSVSVQILTAPDVFSTDRRWSFTRRSQRDARPSRSTVRRSVPSRDRLTFFPAPEL